MTPICRDAAPESAASSRLSASAGASPFGQRVEELVAVLGARVRLRRNGADAFAHPWHAAADAWHTRRDRDADFAGAWIDRRDRERVKDERVAPLERDLAPAGAARSNRIKSLRMKSAGFQRWRKRAPRRSAVSNRPYASPFFRSGGGCRAASVDSLQRRFPAWMPVFAIVDRLCHSPGLTGQAGRDPRAR